jgi:ribosome recycling factor
MKKTINRLKSELSFIRTGRASSSIVDRIKVESYGSFVSLNQIASIIIPDAKTIEIRPWDISQLSAIEKAIIKADIGIMPINDGKIIRISISLLTEDKKKEILKSVSRIAEGFKIAVRNERRFLFENIRKFEKNKIITEDDKKKLEVEAQKITDDYIKKIDESVLIKEKEIMRV